MLINNVELEDLDLLDADAAEKCEIAMAKVKIEASNIENSTLSQSIRKQCTTIFNCFNAICGEGTDKKIFGDKVNLMTCLKAFEELATVLSSKNKEIQAMANKYSPNRADRRTKK